MKMFVLVAVLLIASSAFAEKLTGQMVCRQSFQEIRDEGRTVQGLVLDGDAPLSQSTQVSKEIVIDMSEVNAKPYNVIRKRAVSTNVGGQIEIAFNFRTNDQKEVDSVKIDLAHTGIDLLGHAGLYADSAVIVPLVQNRYFLVDFSSGEKGLNRFRLECKVSNN